MIVEKIHETVSLRQNKRFENFISFNTENGNKAKNDFQKTSVKYSIMQSMEKQWKTCEIV